MRIDQKLTLAFPLAVAAGVGAFGVISFAVSSHQLETALRNSAHARVDAVCHARKEAVEGYIETINGQARTLARNIAVVDAFKRLNTGFRKYPRPSTQPAPALTRFYGESFAGPFAKRNNGAVIDIVDTLDKIGPVGLALQNKYIATSPHPTGNKDELHDPADGTTFGKAHARIHPMFQHFRQEYGYVDIFLVESQSGNIVYSVTKGVDFATSLKDGPYASSGLGRAFQKTNERAINDVVLVDFAPYIPAYNNPAAFIATPVFDGEQRLGVLVVQLPTDRLNATLTARNPDQAIGLGRSGESILVGSDYRLRSQRRALVEDPDRYFQGLVADGVDRAVIEEIKRRGTTIGIEEIRTEPSKVPSPEKTDLPP